MIWRRWAGAVVALSLLLAGLLGGTLPWPGEPSRPAVGPGWAVPGGQAAPSASIAASAGRPALPARPPAIAARVPPVADGRSALSAADAELAHCQGQAAAARQAPGRAEPDEVDLPADAVGLGATWEDVRRRLQGSSQPLQQASALMMERPAPDPAVPNAGLPDSALAPLVALALASADPTVLQWALRFCGLRGPLAACQGLSARIWVQAESDNLMAWLELMHREPQALDEALQGMAQAGRVDSAWMRWVAVVLAARPPGLALPVRMAFDGRLISLGVAEFSANWMLLMKACRDEALADARRRGQCGQIARLLAEHSSDLLSASLGQGLGKRLGWPAERQREHQALQAAAQRQGQAWLAPGLAADCRPVLLEHHLVQMSQLGEVGLARQALQAERATSAARLAPR